MAGLDCGSRVLFRASRDRCARRNAVSLRVLPNTNASGLLYGYGYDGVNRACPSTLHLPSNSVAHDASAEA
jgi:hypothetical protein